MSNGGEELVSVIVPLLNEEENIGPLYKRLAEALSLVPLGHEVILVDDGSTDSTPKRLCELARADPRVKIVRLASNLGQHRAIMKGFEGSSGSMIVTLDGDLQNPPEEMPKLISRLSEGFDVVAGWRRDRKDSRVRAFSSRLLSLFASVATGVRMRDYGCMLRGYKREVLQAVAKYGRHTPFIPTLVTSMGARTCEIQVRHDARERGTSKYSFVGLLGLYFNLVSDFFHLRFGFEPRRRTGARGRIAFFGYGLVGHACFRTLVDMGYDIVCVVTHRDDPREDRWFPSVADLARKKRIEVLSPGSVNEPGVAIALKKARPDLLLSVFYREILPVDILGIPRVGSVNLHPALLPRYRGMASLNWAVIKGEKRTGVTLHHMTEKVDSGDIIGQQPFEIDNEDTIETVYAKAVTASQEILAKFLPAVLSGNAPRIPQDETGSTYFGRRTPGDGRIDWTKSAQEIRNLIRGVTHPFPGATSSLRGRKLWIWEAREIDMAGSPGSIIGSGNGSFIVGTGRGAIAVTRAQPEGEEETNGSSALDRLGCSTGDHFDD